LPFYDALEISSGTVDVMVAAMGDAAPLRRPPCGHSISEALTNLAIPTNCVQAMEAVVQDEQLDIAVPHNKVPAVAAAAQAAPPQRIAVGADGSPMPSGRGAALPSAPTHKVEMTAEDKELEEMMKMAGQA
jgi:hypothetical protein